MTLAVKVAYEMEVYLRDYFRDLQQMMLNLERERGIHDRGDAEKKQERKVEFCSTASQTDEQRERISEEKIRGYSLRQKLYMKPNSVRSHQRKTIQF